MTEYMGATHMVVGNSGISWAGWGDHGVVETSSSFGKMGEEESRWAEGGD